MIRRRIERKGRKVAKESGDLTHAREILEINFQKKKKKIKV